MGTLAEAAGAADGSVAFPEAAAESRRVAAMAEGGRVELLERRVRELERELELARGGRASARARIETMSPEVTDSNPYRCGVGRMQREGRNEVGQKTV